MGESVKDLERIDEILELLRIMWKTQPELRFGQLIFTLQHEYSQANNEVGKVEIIETGCFNKIGFDFYYIEDRPFREFLEQSLKYRGIKVER